MVYEIASSILHLLPILPVYDSQMIAKIVDTDQIMRILQLIFQPRICSQNMSQSQYLKHDMCYYLKFCLIFLYKTKVKPHNWIYKTLCDMSIVSIHLNNKNVIHVMIYFTTLQDVLPQIQIWSFITEFVTITNNWTLQFDTDDNELVKLQVIQFAITKFYIGR